MFQLVTVLWFPLAVASLVSQYCCRLLSCVTDNFVAEAFCIVGYILLLEVSHHSCINTILHYVNLSLL